MEEIVLMPVHIKYKTERQKKYLIRELANKGFSLSSGTYSYEKKKCRIKDIKSIK